MRREEDFPPPSGWAFALSLAGLIILAALALTGLAYGLSGLAHGVRVLAEWVVRG